MTRPPHPQRCIHSHLCKYTSNTKCEDKYCQYYNSHSSSPAAAPVPDTTTNGAANTEAASSQKSAGGNHIRCQALAGEACLFCNTRNNHWKLYCENILKAGNCPLQQAAAKERERVLDAVEKCIEEKWFAIETTETERDAVVATEDLEKVLESLRGEQSGSAGHLENKLYPTRRKYTTEK